MGEKRIINNYIDKNENDVHYKKKQRNYQWGNNISVGFKSKYLEV